MAWDRRSKRRDDLPKDWEKIRLKVLKRDKYRCQWPMPYQEGEVCGNPATDVDHKGDRNDHRLENLWALDSGHHNRKTQGEAAEGRATSRARAQQRRT